MRLLNKSWISIQIALEHNQGDKSLSWYQVYTKKKKRICIFSNVSKYIQSNFYSNKRREIVHMSMGLFSILKRTNRICTYFRHFRKRERVSDFKGYYQLFEWKYLSDRKEIIKIWIISWNSLKIYEFRLVQGTQISLLIYNVVALGWFTHQEGECREMTGVVYPARYLCHCECIICHLSFYPSPSLWD